MKNTVKKLFSFILVAVLILSLSVPAFATSEGDIIILYTNDVHCSTENYPVLAAYRAELISQGHTVYTVDAGDAIQGEIIGALTEGSAIVEIMNISGTFAEVLRQAKALCIGEGTPLTYPQKISPL